MTKYYSMLLVLSIFLTGCGEPRESSSEVKAMFNKALQIELKESPIAPYIAGEKLTIREVETSRGDELIFYYYTVEGKLTDEFDALTDAEKYELLEELEYLDSTDMEFCGEGSNCEVGTFLLKSPTDEYAVEPFPFDVSLNGEYISKPVTASPVTTPPASSNSSDNTGIDKEAVYQYMKSVYDELTNYGENYVPEIHDPQVADMAAAQFGISSTEAGQIYIDGEMGNF